MSSISSPDTMEPVARPAARSDLSKSIRRLLRPVASLQLTVFLFVLALLLVFFGTMAQINSGLWTVMDQYFRSWHVWVPFQLFAEFAKVFVTDFNKETEWKGSFPFPAGNLIGFALLGNLLAAHAVRFRMTWKRSGIFLIHSGMIILMLGEFFTGQLSVESHMVLQLGETEHFIEESRHVEIAVTQLTGDGKTRVVTVPQPMFEQPGWIRDPHLPVDLKVDEYWSNSNLVDVKGGSDDDVIFNDAGLRSQIVPMHEEPGVKSSREDAPMVRVEVFKKGTEESLGRFLLSLFQYRNYGGRSLMTMPKTFSLDGKVCTIEIRNRRSNKTFNLELLKFEHKQYPGTTKAKEFASTVQLRDPENDEDREIVIRMNHPLRYQGLTFYQSGVLPENSGTILQVVDNPVWILPYISCVVVAVGMMIHFGLALLNFQRRRITV